MLSVRTRRANHSIASIEPSDPHVVASSLRVSPCRQPVPCTGPRGVGADDRAV